MYQIKVDKSNKYAVFGEKIGAEFSAPKKYVSKLSCSKSQLQAPPINLDILIYQE